ncbi:MBL fold metallo-hydrolase RNA specificity domain-containing protein [Colwellia sp. 12G3]|uniref:MBL fold metallo-hydrolase RNA specificity domain-containing protein n=1 Tax=Colwellia sp. 12G3 TaxID=2058299 RepID=UPI000C338A44|nr:MBL fold metallo-hydrolase [Colwellia sp. 12G3]PKI17938.1 MBL fold hydrolase [Colwellia sp. 12G3]
MRIQHHGAINGVTGSCHQLHIDNHNSVLIDCGLFQGTEADTENEDHLAINFDISTVKALIVTHCHIDHVGRIPYLLAAGFKGPIYATTATAALLPLVIEDALKVGVTRNQSIIRACIKLLKNQLVPVEYRKWQSLELAISSNSANNQSKAKIKFQMAGHILGSAYVEVDLNVESEKSTTRPNNHRVVFSGDLGAPYAPLLPAPKSPYRADTLIIESTYGDKNHQNRKARTKNLQTIIEKAVTDNGVVLIPAFSIGRTQELLYELEKIIHQHKKQAKHKNSFWHNIDIIVDSPMAAKFTEQYQNFKDLWDKEAKSELSVGRHPLSFEQLYTVNAHQEHLQTVEYLAKRNKPAIVIAASGMCSGGRIVNYLKQFLHDKTADILFVGYQAQGTLGRDIQKYAPKPHEEKSEGKSKACGYVYIDGKKITIKANTHTISGYSAHADQQGLINFVKRMRIKPKHILIVHGDEQAKASLKQHYQELLPDALIEIGK